MVNLALIGKPMAIKRYTLQSAKAPVCNQLSYSECNPCTNACFRAFVIGEHAVLKNWLIHLAIHTKANNATRLF